MCTGRRCRAGSPVHTSTPRTRAQQRVSATSLASTGGEGKPAPHLESEQDEHRGPVREDVVHEQRGADRVCHHHHRDEHGDAHMVAPPDMQRDVQLSNRGGRRVSPCHTWQQPSQRCIGKQAEEEPEPECLWGGGMSCKTRTAHTCSMRTDMIQWKNLLSSTSAKRDTTRTPSSSRKMVSARHVSGIANRRLSSTRWRHRHRHRHTHTW